MPDVTLILRLRHARGLEVQLVKDGVVGLRHDRGRADPSPRVERHAQPNHAAEAVGAQKSGVPRHRRAPIVAGDHRPLGTQSVEEAYHVAD